MTRRLLTATSAALLLALLLALAPTPRTAQAEDVTAEDLGPTLTAYLAERPDLTTCEVIGDVFWDRPAQEIAGAYMALERSEEEYVTLLLNAGATEPQAKMVSKGLSQGNPLFLAMMLQQGRIDRLRALNSVRFATLLEDREAEDGKNTELLRECLAAVVNILGVAPDELVKTLDAKPSFYDISEEWTRPTMLPGSRTWAFTPAGERIPVITLRGDPMTRGYTYGAMVAHKLVDGWKNYVLGLAGDFYPFIANVQDVVFTWPERYLDELKGMYLAILDFVPEEVRKDNPLGRDFEIRDLMAANTLPDWRALACSSISVWGDRLAPEFAGGTLTARNLDYAPGPGRSIFDLHAVVAYQLPEDEGRSWLSIGWAGLNGTFSAMDEDGVTAFIHDSTGMFTVTTGITPRTYALRLGLETRGDPTYDADGNRLTDPGDEFAAVLREHQNLLSTNVHVSWPAEHQTVAVTHEDGTVTTKTVTLQSAVGLEYDGTILGDEAESGVTVRRSGDNPTDDRNSLIVTNHFCTRFDAEFHTGNNSGQRYRLLETASGRAQPGTVDVEAMRRYLQGVGHSMSLHSVIAAPNLRKMWVCFPNAEDKGAPWVEPLELDVMELLELPPVNGGMEVGEGETGTGDDSDSDSDSDSENGTGNRDSDHDSDGDGTPNSDGERDDPSNEADALDCSTAEKVTELYMNAMVARDDERITAISAPEGRSDAADADAPQVEIFNTKLLDYAWDSADGKWAVRGFAYDCKSYSADGAELPVVTDLRMPVVLKLVGERWWVQQFFEKDPDVDADLMNALRRAVIVVVSDSDDDGDGLPEALQDVGPKDESGGEEDFMEPLDCSTPDKVVALYLEAIEAMDYETLESLLVSLDGAFGVPDAAAPSTTTISNTKPREAAWNSDDGNWAVRAFSYDLEVAGLEPETDIGMPLVLKRLEDRWWITFAWSSDADLDDETKAAIEAACNAAVKD